MTALSDFRMLASKLGVAMMILLSIVGMTSSYANPVQVVSIQLQTHGGVLTSVYFIYSSTLGSSTPSTNTQMTSPSGSGSHSIAKVGYGYIWSPQFGSATTISAGTWTVDLWVANSKSGTGLVSIYTTDSAGTIQSTLVDAVATPSFSSSSETQLVMRFSLAQVSVPANGYIEVTFQPAARNAGTLYWGTAQLSNFQVPTVVL
jgi:hypothetical protein